MNILNIVKSIEDAGGEVHVVDMKVEFCNLCDNCGATVQACKTANKEEDISGNCVRCNQYVGVNTWCPD